MVKSLLPTELWQLGGERQSLFVQPERAEARSGHQGRLSHRIQAQPLVLRWSSVMEAKERKNRNPRVAEKYREPVSYIRETENQTEEHNSGHRTECRRQAPYLF